MCVMDKYFHGLFYIRPQEVKRLSESNHQTCRQLNANETLGFQVSSYSDSSEPIKDDSINFRRTDAVANSLYYLTTK
jgi:hypothetical protein